MSLADDFYLIDLQFDGDLKAAPNGDFQIIKGLNNLKQALFNRLVTAQGSLSHRPLYGVGVQLYQNAIASIGNQRELALKIKEQFEQDFRVEKVESVSFAALPDGQFTITYKVLASGFGQISDTQNPFGDFTL